MRHQNRMTALRGEQIHHAWIGDGVFVGGVLGGCCVVKETVSL